MTLSPFQDLSPTGWGEEGIDSGDKYPLWDFCCAPGCPVTKVERHHLVRKSAISGDYWWVQLRDHTIYPNCVPLCHKHHADVTEHRANIKYVDDTFMWCDLDTGDQELDWQPPSWGDSHEHVTFYPPPEQTADDSCPTCLRPYPRERKQTEGPKLRKTYSIAIPQEEREDGAEVLGTLIEESRKEMAKMGLPYGAEETVKYYVLTSALSQFILHASEIMSNGG